MRGFDFGWLEVDQFQDRRFLESVFGSQVGVGFLVGVFGKVGVIGRDRYFGIDAGIFEQYSGLDGRVAGYEALVSVDFCGVQQCACVQVGEDVEQGGSYFEDFWVDDFVGV